MRQTQDSGIGDRAEACVAALADALEPLLIYAWRRHLTAAIEDLIERGGSHMGDFLPHRVAGGTCPRDGAPLQRQTVGGRTTYWCPAHQT